MVVRTILMNMNFDKTIDELMNLTVIITSAYIKHFSGIRRFIRTVKERRHAIVITLAFQYLHKNIVMNVVYFVFLCMNDFLIKNGLSTKHSLKK